MLLCYERNILTQCCIVPVLHRSHMCRQCFYLVTHYASLILDLTAITAINHRLANNFHTVHKCRQVAITLQSI